MNPGRDARRHVAPAAGSTGPRPADEPSTLGPARLPARPPGPAVPRLVLGLLLRHRREARGIGRAEAAAAIGTLEDSIQELEHGRGRLTTPQLLRLCRAYAITDVSERMTLLTLATQDERPVWWNDYRDVIDEWLEGYLALEQTADVIRIYEPQFIPGLLQTSAYTRAVVQLGLRPATDDEVERRVELRARRQAILNTPSAPRVWAILDAAALLRPVGGSRIMFEQLEHLLDLCDHPGITIQILPLHTASAIAARGPITLLRLPEEQLTDIVYLEQQTTAIYLSRPDEVITYRHLLDRLAVIADDAAHSPEELRRRLAGLGSG